MRGEGAWEREGRAPPNLWAGTPPHTHTHTHTQTHTHTHAPPLPTHPSPHTHLGLRAEDDDVDGHVVLLQLLADFDEGGLILRDGRPHKQDDPLALVLVGPVLEGELGDLDGGGQVGGALDGDVLEERERKKKRGGGGVEGGERAGGRSPCCASPPRLRRGRGARTPRHPCHAPAKDSDSATPARAPPRGKPPPPASLSLFLSHTCIAFNTRPRSGVGVTSTRGALPAIVSTPTAFSGLACVLAPASRLTASAWA